MIKFTINSKDILDLCKDEYESAKKALYTGVNQLAKAAETHLIELVKAELNPHHADIFMGGGNRKENIDLDSPSPGVHILTIKDNAVLIDDGKEIDMKTDSWLWKSSNTKTGKNGRYLVIPFKQGGRASSSESETSKFKAQLTGRIKEELELQNKTRKAAGLPKISMGGIERDSKGQIKEGHLHTFDIFGNKKKSSWSDMPLTRLNVYQKIHRDEQGNPITDKKGKVKATRSWLTFRTASESAQVNPETGTAPKDKFFYPAPKTKDFLARTGEWVEQEFYNKILPAIFEKWGDK
jgi:hypothetical protein